MSGILIINTSFTVALISIVHDKKAKARKRSVFGFNAVGLALIVASTIGMFAGITKEVWGRARITATKNSH